MKNLAKVLILVFLVSGFTSCSLFDVDVETTMSGDLDIYTEAGEKKLAGEHEFYSETPINPMDYGDVADNEDKIDRITADGIIATVEYVSTGEIAILAGSVIAIKNSEKSAIWKFGNDMLIQKDTEITLDDVSDIYDDVTDILTSMDVFTIYAEGEASEPGAEIRIRLDIDCTVTGNPF